MSYEINYYYKKILLNIPKFIKNNNNNRIDCESLLVPPSVFSFGIYICNNNNNNLNQL